MDQLLALLFSLLLSRRELRFEPVPEQPGPADCGLSVAAALLGQVPSLEPSDPRGLSLAELSGLLQAGGLRVSCLRLESSDLDGLLGAGLSPLVVHYEKPSPHWALLYQEREGAYALGDPARGLEILSTRDFEKRWSGVALVVDPRGLQDELVERGRAAAERGFNRWAALASEGSYAGGASTSAPSQGAAPELGLSLALALVAEGAESQGLEGSLGLAVSMGGEGLALCLPLAHSASSRGPLISVPRVSLSLSRLRPPWLLAFEAVLSGPAEEGAVASRDRGGCHLSLGLFRILDPVLLGLEVEIGFPEPETFAPPELYRLGIRAVEAVSERFFLAIGSSLSFVLGAVSAGEGVRTGGSSGAWSGVFEIGFGARLGELRAAFGTRLRGAGEDFFLETDLALPLATEGASMALPFEKVGRS